MTVVRRSRDPKEAWNELRRLHEDVYAYMLSAPRDELERSFPQHVRALRFISTASSLMSITRPSAG